MPRRPEPRYHKAKGRWYACVGEPGEDGRRKAVYAPEDVRDKQSAWDWMRAKQAELAAQVVAVDADGSVTVEWVCEHYLAHSEARVAEGKLPIEEHRNKARHLGIAADAIGARAARTVTPDEVTAFGEGLLSLYSPTYARNVCSTLRAAVNWAVKAGHLDASPIKGFKAPTIPRMPARFAERAEAAAFLGYWRTRHPRGWKRSGYERLTILLERCLIRTGARPKELCKLQWSDIRWDGWQTATGHAAAKAVIPAHRWKAGKVTGKPRTIYFTPTLTRSLRRVLDRGAPHAQWVFVHGAGRAGVGDATPWSGGSDLSVPVKKVRRQLLALAAEVRERLKRGESVEPWRVRWARPTIRDEGHDKLVNYRWRHTAISTLLMHGVDVSTVAELTGTSPEMIYRHYGHILSGHLEQAAEKLHAKKLAGRRSGQR